MIRPALLTLLALSLGACAVGPDYAPPALDLPQRWNAAAGSKTAPRPSEWWRGFRDPTLNALIDQAIAGNLDVAQAKARIREARAAREQAVGALPRRSMAAPPPPARVRRHSLATASAPASTPPGKSTCSARATAPSRLPPTAPTPPSTISTR